MEQDEDGREGLKREQQRQDRHLEKVVARRVEEDTALRGTEEEHKRKFVVIENDFGAGGSEAEREVKRPNWDEQSDQNMDQPSDDVTGTKREAEDDGEREEAKRQDGMIVRCLLKEEVTRRDIHEGLTTRGRYCFGSVEESDDNDVNMG